jgi:RNA polymerase sigma-70 factor (ECF subfamily)
VAEPRTKRTTQLAAEVVNHGSNLANEELFQRIFGRLHRYFLRVVRDPNEAEDCLQETLVILAASLREAKFDPTYSFNTWIWLKARTVYAQWCRDRSKRMGELPDVPAEESGLGEVVDARLDARLLLDQLGEESYEIFILYYEGGLTLGEVAELVGRHPQTIRARIDQAHRLIEQLGG